MPDFLCYYLPNIYLSLPSNQARICRDNKTCQYSSGFHSSSPTQCSIDNLPIFRCFGVSVTAAFIWDTAIRHSKRQETWYTYRVWNSLSVHWPKKGTWLFLSTAGRCEDGIGKGQSDKKNYENTRKEGKKSPNLGVQLKLLTNKKQEPQTTFAVKAASFELIFLFLHNILGQYSKNQV